MKRIYKFLFLLNYLVASIYLMNCSDDNPTSPDNFRGNVSNTNFAVEDSFSYKIAVAGHSGLSLEAINGTITIIEESNSNYVRISGTKRVESESTNDAEEHLKELSVDVLDQVNEVFVRTLQPKQSGGRKYIVNYTITLPKNTDLSITSLNGRVTLNEIFSSVFVDLVNGFIEGEVTLPRDGKLDLRSINGSIDIHIPSSTSAEFAASVTNGNISISNLLLQNKVEKSRSLTGTIGDGRGKISLRTTNGEIKLTGF